MDPTRLLFICSGGAPTKALAYLLLAVAESWPEAIHEGTKSGLLYVVFFFGWVDIPPQRPRPAFGIRHCLSSLKIKGGNTRTSASFDQNNVLYLSQLI